MEVFAIYAAGVLSGLILLVILTSLMSWHIYRLSRAIRRKLRVR